MKRQDVNAFLDTVSSQDEFRKEIDDALQGCDDRAAATVEFARKAGFDFSSEEFENALDRRYGGHELSDTELEGVAGGMMPASTKGGGMCLAFPDVCKTPSPGGPVPIPYPNTGMGSGGSKKTRLGRKPR